MKAKTKEWLTVTTISVPLGLLILGGLLTACGSGEGSYLDNRGWGDAPVSTRDDGGSHIVNSPDQFPNVAMKCDGKYGYMVFTVTHSTTDVGPVVIPDPRCPGYRADLVRSFQAPASAGPPAAE
jgi:hypothetical protein